MKLQIGQVYSYTDNAMSPSVYDLLVISNVGGTRYNVKIVKTYLIEDEPSDLVYTFTTTMGYWTLKTKNIYDELEQILNT